MTQYKCVKRVTTDGGKTIHPVGTVLNTPGDMTEADAASLLRQRAVVEMQPPAQASVATQAVKPSLDELKQEESALQEQINELEHEGGEDK